MAENDVEKFLTEQRTLEERRQQLIDELLKAKEAAIKQFDDKLVTLGYQPDGGKPRRSHHSKRPAAQPAASATTPKEKTK